MKDGVVYREIHMRKDQLEFEDSSEDDPFEDAIIFGDSSRCVANPRMLAS